MISRNKITFFFLPLHQFIRRYIIEIMLGRRQLREKVMQNIYAYNSLGTEGEERMVERNMMKSIDQIYDLYIYILNLIKVQKEIAEHRIQLAQSKNFPTQEDLNPNLKFVNNKVFRVLESNLELNRYTSDNKNLLWDVYDSYPNNIYKSLIESDLYKDYMKSGKNSFEEDQEFVLNFFVELIAEYDDLHDYLEGIQITWADDVHIANAMVHTTIKSFRENSSPLISLFKVYKDTDDKRFTEELFRKTIRHQSETKNMIDEKAQNWELDRIATIDLIILEMALTEFLHFPNIPAKVTINEYIELAKNYSTEKSRVFVNGILDKTLKELKDNNNLPKYGRGLL
ncbi:N utilization substance protein B [Algoriella xinjiangensis]|uniref:Transcription antitermination protein NusB n=2 Tax=Algoriella xinjiangensis TaxID=684065 RepID=A0A1I4VG32_9FLAO|nr:N utilization substance protein B [Algoriella xinjiangensis]VDH17153.1 N utilization substance protein B homolog [Algoriella xinjiangensis]